MELIMIEKETEVIFYLSSGDSINVIFKEQSFDKIIQCLRKDWSSTTFVSEESGINFSLVTHYKVK